MKQLERELKKHLHPGSGAGVADIINNANAAALNLILSACDTDDYGAAELIGISPGLQSYLKTKRKSDIYAYAKNCPIAIFRPIFQEASQLRVLATSGFQQAEILASTLQRLPSSMALPKHQQISTATMAESNLTILNAWIQCATSGDPLVGMLLGVSDEILVELVNTSKNALYSAFFDAKLPLFEIRFKDVEIWQGICQSGFSTPLVQREILRGMTI